MSLQSRNSHIDLLLTTADAPDPVIGGLLSDPDATEELSAAAHQVRIARKGSHTKQRGLIEITNRCLNNCLYCGIRAANRTLERYTLSHNEIVAAAKYAYSQGMRTFVLQGGENPAVTDTMVTDVVRELKRTMPDAAVTLSLGERPYDIYRTWREAGADRYLLRHETYNPAHYRSLHPAAMNRENRLRCLDDLTALGYRVGTGFLVGSPGQQLSHIIEDLRFIQLLNPGMIGIGPFIPAANTPFADHKAGDVGLTLRCVAILRLMNPDADIPATTALATLGGPDAQQKALCGGANVVMPKFTPPDARELYHLY